MASTLRMRYVGAGRHRPESHEEILLPSVGITLKTHTHTHTHSSRAVSSSLVLSNVTHELCVHYVYAAWPAAN